MGDPDEGGASDGSAAPGPKAGGAPEVGARAKGRGKGIGKGIDKEVSKAMRSAKPKEGAKSKAGAKAGRSAKAAKTSSKRAAGGRSEGSAERAAARARGRAKAERAVGAVLRGIFGSTGAGAGAEPSEGPATVPAPGEAAGRKAPKGPLGARARRPSKRAPAIVGDVEVRAQVGVLPMRRTGSGEVRVLLVTSRETRRWVIPKGWPMPDRAPHEAAAREAYEEAGLAGTVGERAIGHYVYRKRLKRGSVLCRVAVFPFAVRKRRKTWPEKRERVARWFTPREAALLVAEPDLAALILTAPAPDPIDGASAAPAAQASPGDRDPAPS